ncbi:MAG: cyclic nucleotide-binding domain-containing protein, partial [Chloroflexi bacterium]|nr:cyclic nucleotide-binding domain-containing protein [Chloroflexota bacterium]
MVSDAGAAVTLLRTLPLSAGISDDELLTVAGRLRPGVFAAGESIVREGETGDAWYVVRDGRAAVVSRDLVGLEVTLAVLESGAHFGEGALVGGGLRSATVKALDPVRVYVLNRNDFHELEARCPEFSTKVRRHVDLLAVDSFLRKASPFAHLPDETIRRVAGQLRPEPARSGQIIVQEGEPGDRFYLVWSGRVEVIQKGQRVQVLDAGNCFGEVALLAEVPRTATVRALEDTRLLSLSKSDFEEVVQESAVLQRQFTEFVRIRAGNALARTLAVADPLNALMPDLGGHRRGRYWQFLVGGLALFGALTLLASRTQITGLVYAALLVGSFLGPLVYVAYLAESHLLTERPFRLGVTFVLAAGLGIPVAATIEGMIGAHRGTFMSALMIGVVEEPAKALGVTWLLLRSRS